MFLKEKKKQSFTLNFRIPLQGERRKKWVDNITQHQKLYDAFTQINVCSLHFEKKDILKSKKLSKQAVPTIFG